MRPYFEREGIVIYHGDAAEVLPSLTPESVDLLLTDPPYGVRFQSRMRTGEMFPVMAGDDGSLDLEAIIGDALRVLRNSRHVYIFGPFQVGSLPLASLVELIWDKGNFGLGDHPHPQLRGGR